MTWREAYGNGLSAWSEHRYDGVLKTGYEAFGQVVVDLGTIC